MKEDCESLVQKLQLLAYFEASASTNANVDTAFFTVAYKAYEIQKKLLVDEQEDQQNQYFKLTGNEIKGRTSTMLNLEDYVPHKKKKGKCCRS